jgi:hypothetical protein
MSPAGQEEFRPLTGTKDCQSQIFRLPLQPANYRPNPLIRDRAAFSMPSKFAECEYHSDNQRQRVIAWHS